MSHIEFKIILLVAGLLCLLTSRTLVRKVRSIKNTWHEARQYMAKMQEPGFIPPPPTDKDHARMMRVARFLTWLFVGKVKVTGLENLDALETNAYIVTPNHPSPFDITVLPVVLNRKTRFMAALGVMQTLRGLGGLVVGPFGAFAANLDRGKGAPALRAAIQIVASRQTLVMWPEGWTYLDGKMRAFKRGAVKIAKQAAVELQEPTFIVPVAVRYGRYPGAALMRLPIKLQYLVLAAAFPLFRRGVTVTIGKPISSRELPDCDSAATQHLRSKVAELGCQCA